MKNKLKEIFNKDETIFNKIEDVWISRQIRLRLTVNNFIGGNVCTKFERDDKYNFGFVN